MRFFLAALALVVLLPPPDALACSCAGGTPAYEMDRSDAVFTGRVVGLRLIEGPQPIVRVELRVIERLKGDGELGVVFVRGPEPIRAVFTLNPDGSIGPGKVGGVIGCATLNLFTLGAEYLVAAFRNRPGTPDAIELPEAEWETYPCSATYELESQAGRRYLAGFREILKNSRP